jgi:uncharacterized phage protein (TIGR01671 family)
MREIKFRAWHNSAKEMLFEDLSGDVFKWYNEKQPVKIMQYTGLKSKSGVEIYEGDVVKFKRNPFQEHCGKISFSPAMCRFSVYVLETKKFCEDYKDGLNGVYGLHDGGLGGDDDALGTNELEVIGNIYENPKLLKEAK